MGYINIKCPECGKEQEFVGSWAYCSKCDKYMPIDDLEEGGE